ncbi:hypothetical protein ACFQZE_23350 [Paenibacillus sp. GCM10027627]|uniref:hypothetical protein n=1 Tax=unclassified Paenibacillus TaxID=185978 RepID=UPI0036361B35
MEEKERGIHFRRLTLDDMNLMYKWLTTDAEVKGSWGYAHQGTFEETVSEFVGCVNGDDPTEPYLILNGDTPIGYIQTFRWSDYPGYEQYVDLNGEGYSRRTRASLFPEDRQGRGSAQARGSVTLLANSKLTCGSTLNKKGLLYRS